MNPRNMPPKHLSLTSANKVRLQVSQQYAEELVGWLINKAIPFELNFERVKEINQPMPENADLQASLPIRPPIVNSFADTVQKYIIDKLEGTPPSIDVIAKELGISDISFKNRFRKIYGKPFYQLYMEKRMEHAAQLLRQGYKAVEVSIRIGYGEKSCIKFNKMFQKHFGMTPKKYQMSQK